ncbi:MAG: beta-lactamase family protein [Acidobacteria bacterium]|nr:beta-lactamase family protein [Acidobacteriota bacterium]MBK9705854.1 beta-lactamase family protein [Acidobacteriota bacterium]
MQIGSQVYVSRHGKPLADFALGLARADVPMTTDTMMIWFSSTKAITAVAVAQQWERGKFDLDEPVAKHIPEFGNHRPGHRVVFFPEQTRRGPAGDVCGRRCFSSCPRNVAARSRPARRRRVQRRFCAPRHLWLRST